MRVIVYVKRELYEELVAYSTNLLPNEACGLILGQAFSLQSDELHAQTFIPLRNQARSPTSQFAINPIDMLPYLNDSNRDVLGLFHTHPTAAPIPSAEDLLTFWHTLPTYWILSLQHEGNPNLQVYQLKKTTMTTYHKLSFVIGQ